LAQRRSRYDSPNRANSFPAWQNLKTRGLLHYSKFGALHA
jgi:hypothetical protein